MMHEVHLGQSYSRVVVINHFDITAAQTSTGYLGIHLTQALALRADNSLNPFITGTPGNQSKVDPYGNSQSFTISDLAASTVAQTLQLAISGSGNYWLSSGSTQTPFSGTLSLTIPAGQTSATYTLIDLSNSNSADTATLTATLKNGNGTVSSNNLSITFGNPLDGAVRPDNISSGEGNDFPANDDQWEIAA